MRPFLAIALVLALLGGCQSAPIYDVAGHPMPIGVRSFPIERIEALIIEAGQMRQWTFERAGSGHLLATQTHPKYSAIVDIYFDQASYRITYNSSTGLDEKDGSIHPHYNLWIRNLERDIYNRLANAAAAS